MQIKSLIVLCSTVLFVLSACAKERVVYVRNVAQNEDATLNVLAALKECKDKKATKLVFEKGNYNFLSRLAPERYVSVSNNDPGLKRVLFDLTDMTNLEIDGQGSDFMFNGYVVPFLLNRSKDITIRNLSFDFKRTFHSEGKIVGAYVDSIDVEFSKEYPYYVENNKLMFTGDEFVHIDCAGRPRKELYPFWHLLEFKKERREPIAGIEYLPVQTMIVNELRPGVVRLFHKRMSATVGNTMVFNAEYRSIPGIIVSDSKNTKILGVTIYHAGGMGVVGQRSEDIFLDSVKVIAAPNRMVSTTADATHFVHCSGKITMQNCQFESMMDDATNIHGVYMRIDKIISPTEMLLKLVHYQQYGFEIFEPNMNIEIVDPKSLNTKSEYKVKQVERYNQEYFRLVTTSPINDDIKLGDAVCSIDQNPEILMTHCSVSKNRARGMLLGSRGNTIIENNYFHTHAATITLEGDARFWYEQAGARNLTIRNNYFDECNYAFFFGFGVLFTGSGIEEDQKENSRYHRNILIEDNTFKMVGPCLINMYSIDNLTFRNNKYEESTDPEYKVADWAKEYIKSQNIQKFIIKHSSNINIQE